MELVNLNYAKRKAFRAGFWRGLASPVLIYSTFTLPESASPKLQEVANPAKRSDGLRGDWKRVGKHVRAAIESEVLKHG